MQVDDTLVDAHLIAIPGLGALTARSFARGDAQHLGGHAHWSVDLEVLVLGALDQVRAHLLQALYVRARQRDADTMHGNMFLGLFALFLIRLLKY